MTARKPKDEISRLLDSFQEEEVLEEKMEGFTAQKRRQDRMQRASRQTVEPEPVQNETNDTIDELSIEGIRSSEGIINVRVIQQTA